MNPATAVLAELERREQVRSRITIVAVDPDDETVLRLDCAPCR
jgi:hypothetical protein